MPKKKQNKNKTCPRASIERCLQAALIASKAIEKAERQKQEQAAARNNPDSFTTLPSTDDEIEGQLMKVIIEAHLHSRPLGRLPPSALWNQHQKETWAGALQRECLRLNTALDAWQNENNGLAFLNAMTSLITLPARTIIPASKLKPASGPWTIEQDDTVYTIDLGGETPPSQDEMDGDHPPPGFQAGCQLPQKRKAQNRKQHPVRQRHSKENRNYCQHHATDAPKLRRGRPTHPWNKPTTIATLNGVACQDPQKERWQLTSLY